MRSASILLAFACCSIASVSASEKSRIVFTHDASNQIGNVYDMMETENGSIAFAGYYGIVFLDRDYNVIQKKQINGAFINVELARFADGVGMVGYNRKPISEDLRIPHLLKVAPDLGDFTETRLCDTCANIGVADFDGNGIDTVVIAGDDAFTLHDLSDDSARELAMSWLDTRIIDIHRVTETDFDCDGREEFFFRAGYDCVLEQDNEWETNHYFVLHLDGQDYRLTNYRTYLRKNWKQVRKCDSTVKQKDPLKVERYFDHFLTQLSPGNVGQHYTDSPIQEYLKLENISHAEEQSWEVKMTGMRRRLNFYPLVDTDCIAESAAEGNTTTDCTRYLSVYARYGHGCEQFFWENEDCGTWVLLLFPDGTWETVATWPNWSFTSLLTSDGRLLFHSVADLLEIKLPENLVRPR